MRITIIYLLMFSFLFSCKKAETLPNDQVLEFPVVFHILHEGAAIGSGDNVPASVVQYGINLLNNVYSANSTKIKFRLARTGPSGQTMTEPGIDRINIGRTSLTKAEVFTNNAWGKNYVWNPDEYINIFILDVIDSPDGWTYAPFTPSSSPNIIKGLSATSGDDYANSPNSQAIFLRKDFFAYQAGLGIYWPVLPHEMGHYLGLFHLYSNACTTDGDFCDDTRDYNLANNPNITSTGLRTDCKGQSYQSNNMMDYLFHNPSIFQISTDQIKRMRSVSANCILRKNVWKSSK
jgi:Pregnancy-associated plasma protein-A